MKKLPIALTLIDIVAIVVFVLLTLGGIGAWYYYSGQLQTVQGGAVIASSAFKKYSSDTKYNVVVSHRNGMTLQGNIDTLKGQLGPLIQVTLQSKDDKLSGVAKEDSVAWKHDLDDEVHRLNVAAKIGSVGLPQNFYYGFGRYQGQSPGDDQTAVLTKQMLGIHQIATILISAPVKSIQAIRRTYEEDPRGGQVAIGDADHLSGLSYSAADDVYKAYPFEVDFKIAPENLRSVINGLVQSPYLLVLRTVTVHSSNATSPMNPNSLDSMAGPPQDTNATSVSPGEVAQAAPTKGPQFLFGNATLDVKIRVDMIEWNYQINPVKK